MDYIVIPKILFNLIKNIINSIFYIIKFDQHNFLKKSQNHYNNFSDYYNSGNGVAVRSDIIHIYLQNDIILSNLSSHPHDFIFWLYSKCLIPI